MPTTWWTRRPRRPPSPPGRSQGRRVFNLENLSDPENTTIAHHINQAIKAHGVMKRDVDYVIKDGEIIIVDEFTGRLMFGRRYRGSASGHRGQGGRPCSRREQDAGHHHLPELLPPVSEAVRYDRYRPDGGGGICHHL